MLRDVEISKNLSQTGQVKQELLRKDVLSIINVISTLRRKRKVIAILEAHRQWLLSKAIVSANECLIRACCSSVSHLLFCQLRSFDRKHQWELAKAHPDTTFVLFSPTEPSRKVPLFRLPQMRVGWGWLGRLSSLQMATHYFHWGSGASGNVCNRMFWAVAAKTLFPPP